MKKILVIFFILICIVQINANPIPPPLPYLAFSEFLFESENQWVIEIQYEHVINDFADNKIDSIFICSSTGRAKIKQPILNNYFGYYTVRNDSLFSNLFINPVGDNLVVEYYCKGYMNPYRQVFTDSIVFGNFENATLPAPKIGESIAAYSYYSKYLVNTTYSIDFSPSTDAPNDSSGMCGTLNGFIYDINNELLTTPTHEFFCEGITDFKNNADGSFSARIFSNNKIKSKIYYHPYGDRNNLFTVDILPVMLSVLPDTVVYADIHIQKITAINEVSAFTEPIFHLYPNPLHEPTLNYEITVPVKSTSCFMALVNLDGKTIARFNLQENKGKIILPSEIANGTYTCSLFVNNKNYANEKIMVVR